MNGIERRRRVWNNLKQRLGLKGMGCCGSMWSFRTQTLTIMPPQEEEPEEQERETHVRMHTQNAAASVTAGAGTGTRTTINMNLAMALAAERNLRAGDSLLRPNKNAGTAVKTLMMLIEETDGGDWQVNNDGDVEGGEALILREGSDWMCCVCMERNKGAAFIPCGHAFCRVCSRDLWLNRGTCPICNRSIIEILDIF